jgi:hypothetical protein
MANAAAPQTWGFRSVPGQPQSPQQLQGLPDSTSQALYQFQHTCKLSVFAARSSSS